MTAQYDRDSEAQQPSGYLPQGWREIRLGEVCETPVSGYSPVGSPHPAKEGEKGVLKLNCIQANRFHPENNKAVPKTTSVALKAQVKKDTLIVSRSNTQALVGTVCYVDKDYPDLFLSDLLWCVSGKRQGSVDLRWLAYVLSSAPYRAKIAARANGTSDSMRKITKAGFLNLRIAFPRLEEQRKIAEILSIWESAIDQTQRLITAKTRHRRALAQQLLTGKSRFAGFPGENDRKYYRYFDLPIDWRYPAIRDIAQERSERNGNHRNAVMLSCSKHSGFVESSAYFGKRKSSADTSNYKVIRRGWFGYPSNHIEEGSIGLLQTFDTGIVSPIYTVFECTHDVVPEFLYAVFKTPTFRHIFSVSTNASVDRRGSLRWKAFSSIRVPLPGRDEQKAIVTFLQTADAEITFLKKRCAHLEQQKRGLMQNLLTGKIRVQA